MILTDKDLQLLSSMQAASQSAGIDSASDHIGLISDRVGSGKDLNDLKIEFDGTTVLCRVCGDKASGFHYGVHSCEGCKGFFRRSIQQKIQYRPCTKNQQCSILRINRNRCQYCRLKKCIAVGMSRDAVRFGRVPKREKAKILAAMQKVNAHSLDKALSAVLEDEQCISVTIATAHEETCDYTREKVAPLLEAARSRPVYAQCPPSMTCPLNPIPIGTLDPAQSARILEDFSERFSPAIRGVVDFAKRIPGFGMLSQEDQVTLLKAGVFEVLLVRLACMFDSPSASMVCLNGLVLRRDALHSASNARFLLDSMFDFAERLNSLRLSDHEIGLFCAVVVIAPDRPGLRNVDLVTKINKRLEEVLQKTIAGNHPNDVASGQLIFSELTKKIPDLRTLNTLHSEKLIGKNFMTGETTPVASSTTSGSSYPHHHNHHHHQEMASSAVHHPSAVHSQSSQQAQPDSSDNSPSDRWSSSSSLGHFSPATSTEDGRSVSPTSGPWGEHQQKQSNGEQAFGSPRSMSSSSGVSSEDSHSRKGSISLPSAPPKLAYISSYVRGLSSPVVVSSEHGHSPAVSSEELSAASTASHYNANQHLHPYSKAVTANGHHHHHHHLTANNAGQQQHRVDSPTDSGIDHHSSVCSSPSRTSGTCPAEESAKGGSKLSVVIAGNGSPRHSDGGSALTSSSSDSEGSEKQESIDDMPVLKRALQAPPLVNTNKLMDEAYRHHKKFRAAARRDTEPHSPSTTTGPHIGGGHSPLPSPAITTSSSSPSNHCSSISSSSLASTHSTLLKTLEQPSRYLSEQQLKRTDLIHNIIMNSEAVSAAASALSSVPTSLGAGSLYQSQHALFSGSSAAAKQDNLAAMFAGGANFYQHHSHHQQGMPAVCPFTGRSASSGAIPSSSASPSSSSSTYQIPSHFAKSPEVAAAAAGLLVIGSSVPPPPPMVSVSGAVASSGPSTPSSSSLGQQHSSPVVVVSPGSQHAYSHLARCLTATTAPALVQQQQQQHGRPELMAPTIATSPPHPNDDDDDAQPLNLSKKAACPAVGSTLRQSSPAISCPSTSSLKMDVDA